VAVPSPLHGTFDYLPAPEQVLPYVGARVLVRFGRQQVVGIVVGINAETEVPAEKLRAIEQSLDNEPLLPLALLNLYRWASSYYLFPLGMSLQTSLPKALREGKPLSLPAQRVWQLATTTAATRKPSVNQQRVLDLLANYQRLSTAELSALLGSSSRPALTALAARGQVSESTAPLQHVTTVSLAQPTLTLNSEQAHALGLLLQGLHHYRCTLLEGITGSGKTEIYLQLIAEVLARGQQVLVLVPEISLTPQTIARFSSRFHARIVAFHSGLSDKQRLQGWLEAANGIAHIVIGTRSAAFTPLAKPGLIVVDEEHDDSYKQQDGFLYSGRDVAIYRASSLNIPVLLGSATPSLESLQNALQGRYQHLQLNQRAGAATLPSIMTLDLKLQPTTAGISLTLLQKIKDTLGANQQVLVFLNRRGFAPVLQCPACGWIAECPRCERSYTLHQQPSALRCHHCDAHKPLPRACPCCHSSELAALGLGTERVASYLTEQFPDYPVLRIDRDTTRGANKLNDMMDTVHSGIPCLLVGTQMLAKGHHFPRVTLVAVLDTDSGLFSADFRAQENLGQLLMQVAGRAGRDDLAGQVVVQTYYPQHPALMQLVTEGYGPFARMLLHERQSGGLPPFVHFILLRAEGNRRELPFEFLQAAFALIEHERLDSVVSFGPMPSPFGKKAGLFRAQLLVQAKRRANLQKLGALLLKALEQHPLTRKVRWAIDVDPTDFS
jgi:primosomal protein N' (replication factor Y) (superfamily II helicase)